MKYLEIQIQPSVNGDWGSFELEYALSGIQSHAIDSTFGVTGVFFSLEGGDHVKSETSANCVAHQMS